MPHNFPEADCRAPLHPDFDRVFNVRAFPPFSDVVLFFLEGLSAWLMQDAEAKVYPDVISFAFWCRRSALMAMKEKFSGNQLRMGRGIVFHVAPSNVPVNFAYSLVAGLLAGNANIVRLPSKEFPQVDIICRGVCAMLALSNFSQLADYIVLLRYDRRDEATAFFSSHCDVRIIWGGDQTIAGIRKSPLPPRAFDITFADRYSFCVIQADEYIARANPARVAQDFYNDTYLLDQNACTAPHLLVWLGSAANIAAAKEIFWQSLHECVAGKYRLQPISAVDKLADSYRNVAMLEGCKLAATPDNLIMRISLPRLVDGLETLRSACGYFCEYDAEFLEEIVPVVTRKFQTLAYFGFQSFELERLIREYRPCGIDRIVPIGRTLDFSLVWDGYDLVTMLSRIITLAPAV
jgi:hypothetical protein